MQRAKDNALIQVQCTSETSTRITTFFFSSVLEWQSTADTVHVEAFSAAVGPAIPLPATILETFQLFFTAAIVNLVVDQTNLYAAQVLGERVATTWVDVTENDILAFFGFAILMGVNQLPALVHYWRKNPIFHYSPIADRISRDRFLQLWRFLHFVDNNTLPDRSDPEYDRLGKVRPVISAVQEACRSNYNGSRNQSIDEAMIAFKGRSSMKQYMPKKPTKRGFKVWVRSDSANGYVCQLQCYTGKQSGGTEVGLGANVVTRLTRDLVGQHYAVHVDNFFSSIPLFQKLLGEGIYATGTLRTNRKLFPRDLAVPARRGLASRGDIQFRQHGNLVVTVWQDTKPVVILSTQHSPTITTLVRRKKGDGNTINVTCPQAIVDYNANMGGVDLGDQYRHYYQVRMKSHKFYKYIFWFLFEVCILNSYILHRYSPCIGRNLTYLDYRVELAQQLIGSYCSRKRLGRPPSSSIPPPKHMNVAHFPAKTTNGRCFHCKEGRTVWHCSQCDKRLCHTGKKDTDCYLIYHTTHGLM